MGRLLNNDVIKLIQSIVVKNKIRSCCWEYHKTYILISNDIYEKYSHRKAMNFYAFNFRSYSCCTCPISKLDKSNHRMKHIDLPKNYKF